MLDLEFVHFLPFSKGCLFNIGTDKKHDNSIMTATNWLELFSSKFCMGNCL